MDFESLAAPASSITAYDAPASRAFWAYRLPLKLSALQGKEDLPRFNRARIGANSATLFEELIQFYPLVQRKKPLHIM